VGSTSIPLRKRGGGEGKKEGQFIFRYFTGERNEKKRKRKGRGEDENMIKSNSFQIRNFGKKKEKRR